MFCGNYILSGIFDKCYIFIRKNKNVEVITPTFIIQPKNHIKGKCLLYDFLLHIIVIQQ